MYLEVVIVQLILILAFFFVLFVFARRSSSSKNKMKLSDSVTKEYQEKAYEILKNNSDVIAARNKYKTYSMITIILTILFFGLSFLYFYNRAAIFLIVGLVCIISVIVLSIKKNSKAIFKIVIPAVISAYKEGLKYKHDSGIDPNSYRSAGFERWDKYNSEDLIMGTFKGSLLRMSEVHTQRRYTDKDGHTHYQTIFRGTFAEIDLYKDFGAWLSIVNNKIKLFNRDKYITLENTEFEKIYDVFTDDKIKAMELLTPDVTTQMIDLYNETGLYCEIKIMNKKLYIRLYTSAIFELGFSTPEKEAKQIGSCMAVIDNVFKITENIMNVLERFDE